MFPEYTKSFSDPVRKTTEECEKETDTDFKTLEDFFKKQKEKEEEIGKEYAEFISKL